MWLARVRFLFRGTDVTDIFGPKFWVPMIFGHFGEAISGAARKRPIFSAGRFCWRKSRRGGNLGGSWLIRGDVVRPPLSLREGFFAREGQLAHRRADERVVKQIANLATAVC